MVLSACFDKWCTFIIGLMNGQHNVGIIDGSGFNAEVETLVVARIRTASDDSSSFCLDGSRLLK